MRPGPGSHSASAPTRCRGTGKLSVIRVRAPASRMIAVTGTPRSHLRAKRHGGGSTDQNGDQPTRRPTRLRRPARVHRPARLQGRPDYDRPADYGSGSYGGRPAATATLPAAGPTTGVTRPARLRELRRPARLRQSRRPARRRTASPTTGVRPLRRVRGYADPATSRPAGTTSPSSCPRRRRCLRRPDAAAWAWWGVALIAVVVRRPPRGRRIRGGGRDPRAGRARRRTAARRPPTR